MIPGVIESKSFQRPRIIVIYSVKWPSKWCLSINTHSPVTVSHITTHPQLWTWTLQFKFSAPCHLSGASQQCITAHSWSQHPGPPMIFCAGSGDHPGIVSPWSQIFSLNTECIVNFARYNEYSGEANLCHKGCVTKPPPLPPSLPCPLRVINIIFRFVIFGEFNNTLLYNAFLSYFI